MHLNTLTFTVRAKPEKVFDILADPRNIPRWNSQTQKVEPVKDVVPAEGYIFEAGSGRHMSRYHITVYEPPRRVRFEEQGGVRFRGTITLAPTPSGSTTISYEQHAESKLLFKLLKPFIRRSAAKYNQQDEALIRDLVEKH